MDLGVTIDIPSEIVLEGFRDSTRNLTAGGGYMVFKTVFADVTEQRLQFRNFKDAVSAEGVEFVIGEFAFTDVGSDFTELVIRGDSGESERSRSDLSADSAIGIFFADRTGDNSLIIHLILTEEGFGQIGAVEEDSFIGIFAKVVVPIQKCGRSS